MSRIRLLLVGMLLIFMAGVSAPAGAAVWSGNFNGISEDTTFSFVGDGINNLNIEWRNEGSTNVIFGPSDYRANPGYSDALIFNVGSSIDINTFDAEIEVDKYPPPQNEWHDASDSFVQGEWVALKGENGYYGVLHITTLFTGFGPPPNISGTWYFQDDGTPYFGSAVPVPGAIWLLGSGLIGLVSLRKKFKK